MNSTLQMIRGDTAKYNFQRLDAHGQVITAEELEKELEEAGCYGE